MIVGPARSCYSKYKLLAIEIIFDFAIYIGTLLQLHIPVL